MKKLMIAGIAAAALAGGAASAADLARPVPVYRPPPVVAYFTWTGCYVGGNGGGVWADWDWTSPALGADFGSHSASGGIIGGQIGCNYQVGGWVFGIQGDYDWTQLTGNSANTFLPLLTDQSSIRSLASVTGRVGYAWDRFLLYAKGGGAWARNDYSLFSFTTALVPGARPPFVGSTGTPIATTSETRSGWTVGVGGEYAFLNWLTGFVEYDFYGFGTSSSTFICGPVNVCGAAATIPFNVRTSDSVIKGGLNFKFGPTAPLLARY